MMPVSEVFMRPEVSRECRGRATAVWLCPGAVIATVDAPGPDPRRDP